MQFRFKALAQMREPDELDRMLRLAAPGSWVATAVVALVLVSGSAWAFAGSVPRTVTGQGLLTRPLGVSAVQADVGGFVVAVPARLGADVASGDELARVLQDGHLLAVHAPFPGRVVEVQVSDGQLLAVGGPVVVIERTDAADDRLLASVFVPVSAAVALRRGTPVDLAVSSAPRQAFGVLRGAVTSVDSLPVSPSELVDLIGDSPLAKTLGGDAGLVHVVVDLEPDPHTVSGLRWSTHAGPPFPVLSRAEVSAVFRVGDVKPVQLVFDR